MPKKGGYDWIRKFDRFADPVYLTLNQQKKIKTPCGGALTVIVTSFVLYWLLEQILIEVHGKFSSTTELTNLSNGDTTDVFTITPDKLTFSSRLVSNNDDIDSTNMENYFG